MSTRISWQIAEVTPRPYVHALSIDDPIAVGGIELERRPVRPCEPDVVVAQPSYVAKIGLVVQATSAEVGMADGETGRCTSEERDHVDVAEILGIRTSWLTDVVHLDASDIDVGDTTDVDRRRDGVVQVRSQEGNQSAGLWRKT